MPSIVASLSSISIPYLLFSIFAGYVVLKISESCYNVLLHPLSKFPGPMGAKATDWWKTYIEVYKAESMGDVLQRLHKEYDESSFGYLKYEEAKQRRDVLLPLFSRRAIVDMQRLIRNKMDQLANKLVERHAAGKSSDLYLAFRCFTVDTVITFCFAKDMKAIKTPEFKAPLVEAMDAANPNFILMKHFVPFRKMLLSMPPSLAIKASPETAGLTNMQVMFRQHVKEVTENHDLLTKVDHPTVYQRLLDPASHEDGRPPTRKSLAEEAQTMIFGGTDTVGNTSMMGFFHIADQHGLQTRLREEVRKVWPDIAESPDYQTLERLPLLTAAIKESLRLSSGVTTPMPRVVPSTGATIGGYHIPGGTVVGMSTVFVHYSEELFPDPRAFKIERWLDNKESDQWMVAFSKGPRSCLGINLGWCELYIVFATMLRRFEITLDKSRKEDLVWRDTFLPYYYGRHLTAWCKPVAN